jgi:hypothetical protein
MNLMKTMEISRPVDEAAIRSVVARLAVANQYWADQQERTDRIWLTIWAGMQWGDEAPNRLFGAWVNRDGEAI